MRDFFVSYAGPDRDWAEWIAWQLERAEYTTVLQDWDFRPGQNFVLEMNKALENSRRLIAVLSPDYLESDWTKLEWAACLDPQSRPGTVVPVRVRDFSPEGLLRRIVWIDLVGINETRAVEKLLAGLREDRAKPQEPPPYPGTVKEPPHKPSYPGGTLLSIPDTIRFNSKVLDSLKVMEQFRVRIGSLAEIQSAWSSLSVQLSTVKPLAMRLEDLFTKSVSREVYDWVQSLEIASSNPRVLLDLDTVESLIRLRQTWAQLGNYLAHWYYPSYAHQHLISIAKPPEKSLTKASSPPEPLRALVVDGMAAVDIMGLGDVKKQLEEAERALSREPPEPVISMSTARGALERFLRRVLKKSGPPEQLIAHLDLPSQLKNPVTEIWKNIGGPRNEQGKWAPNPEEARFVLNVICSLIVLVVNKYKGQLE